MPTIYKVHGDGHSIHTVARGSVTGPEFVEYEVAHDRDPSITPPAYELLEIELDALSSIRKEHIAQAFVRRKEGLGSPALNPCAILLSTSRTYALELGSFYVGMMCLHYPQPVVVFGDRQIAKTWLAHHAMIPKRYVE